MATLKQDSDNLEANPSNNSGGSSPRSESGRSSSPQCAICLGTCQNKSFTDSCLHQFCFNCLQAWSNVKAECPLCKQKFRSIIHNVQENQMYDEYVVGLHLQGEEQQMLQTDTVMDLAPRFRYRTTLTLHAQQTSTIEQMLLNFDHDHRHIPRTHIPRTHVPRTHVPRTHVPRTHVSSRHLASFRCTVYRHNLWARPLSDFNGRLRDCTPTFYRYNTTQTHRLIPWLNRELSYLLHDNTHHIAYVLEKIMELLPQYYITSSEFRDAMQNYFGDRTEHFLHELSCFASTPYDMPGYDQNVQYTTHARVSRFRNEVISSTESEGSNDSDVVMVSSSEPLRPLDLGFTRFLEPSYPHSYIPTSNDINNVISIETISHSDTDDNDEVTVVGYIRPPQDRTPEIVDLLGSDGSDSDVIVQETSQAALPSTADTQERNNLVKVSLKRHRPENINENTDSDGSFFIPVKRKNLRTIDPTWSTPSPTQSDTNWSPSSWSSTITTSTSNCNSTDSIFGFGTSSDSEDVGRKSKRKHKKDKRYRRKYKDCHKKIRSEKGKRSKHKLRSSKGVKSLKRQCQQNDLESMNRQLEMNLPSTSGISRSLESRDSSREGRRLKSVVKVVMKEDASVSGDVPIDNRVNAVTSHNWVNESVGNEAICKMKLPNAAPSYADNFAGGSQSDSDDDLPLNLTLGKANPVP